MKIWISFRKLVCINIWMIELSLVTYLLEITILLLNKVNYKSFDLYKVIVELEMQKVFLYEDKKQKVTLVQNENYG